ncbi:MAG: YgfZ/GcvT domain-containing protein [Gammaproteobacteria bacterium]
MNSQAPSPVSACLHHGSARLSDWGVIRAQGEDAARFLHGQLTQDFSLLGLSEARLAAFCSAKGRMLASFIGFKLAHDDIVLICHREVLPTTLKRLSMFVLRAKVKLSDATDSIELWGQVGDAAGPAGPAWQQREATAPVHRIGLYPAAGQTRCLWVAPAGHDAPAGPALDPAIWNWLEVLSGVAMIRAPIVEAFVPQMLNYESVGGVNFKKGCYPGQEVVARSQFRGTLKRRAYLAACDGPMAIGQDVFHSSDPEQPTGTVAACAPSAQGIWHAVVSMQTSSAQDGSLHLGSATGPLMHLLPLPYPLVDDI